MKGTGSLSNAGKERHHSTFTSRLNGGKEESVLTLQKANATHSFPSQTVPRRSTSLRKILLSCEQWGRKKHTEGTRRKEQCLFLQVPGLFTAPQVYLGVPRD